MEIKIRFVVYKFCVCVSSHEEIITQIYIKHEANTTAKKKVTEKTDHFSLDDHNISS